MILPIRMIFDLHFITGEEIMMTIVGMGVVYLSLFIIYAVFQNLPRLLNISFKKRMTEKEQKISVQPVKKEVMSGEMNAAISAALYMYFNELHDDEDAILTIQKVSRTYSPWSSKIYSVMNFRR